MGWGAILISREVKKYSPLNIGPNAVRTRPR